MDVDCAVVAVAGMELAVEDADAVALDLEILGHIFLQAGEGHDDLEG